MSVLSSLGLEGQDLSQLDYENLSFRGLGVFTSAVLPNRVDGTIGVGGRVDLGYLGPGVRLLPTVAWWSSDFDAGEVQALEGQLLRLINGSLPPGEQISDVQLGAITWSDLAIGLDAHVVWALPDLRVLTYLGGGFTAHLLNGEGAAITGTFVEDLLDRVTAGLNAHVGIEVPFHPQWRAFGETRFELMEDLRYLEFRAGVQIMVRPTVPPELGR